jgi:hypothetical protein
MTASMFGKLFILLNYRIIVHMSPVPFFVLLALKDPTTRASEQFLGRKEKLARSLENSLVESFLLEVHVRVSSARGSASV